MITYNRINEDYLDSIDSKEYTDEVSMNIDTNVDMLLQGQAPNIVFNIIDDAIYPVYEKNELQEIIENCMKIYGNDCNLNWINTSDIKDMSDLFHNSEFNGDISKWDVSNVETMEKMFLLSKFNGNISNWNVSSVTNMSQMFNMTYNFNSDISMWDVSNVTNMCMMFSYADEFTGDLSKWNVSKVENHKDMFSNCQIEDKPWLQPKFKL